MDDILRAAERAIAASDPRAKADLLMARLRSGLVDLDRVKFAAQLGVPIALTACPSVRAHQFSPLWRDFIWGFDRDPRPLLLVLLAPVRAFLEAEAAPPEHALASGWHYSRAIKVLDDAAQLMGSIGSLDAKVQGRARHLERKVTSLQGTSHPPPPIRCAARLALAVSYYIRHECMLEGFDEPWYAPEPPEVDLSKDRLGLVWDELAQVMPLLEEWRRVCRRTDPSVEAATGLVPWAIGKVRALLEAEILGVQRPGGP